ncbi:MAG: hypothetical protein ACI39R_02500, partial [Lachnospiraceae bacterium]
MKGFGMLKRDLNLGLLKKWHRYIFIVIVVFVCSFRMRDQLDSLEEMGMGCSVVSFWDYLCANFQGMTPYVIGVRNYFYVPVLWFCVQICFHYIIAYYPEQDFREHGRQVLIHSKSRTGWWLSKCLWCLAAALVYFVLILVSVAVFELILEGNITFEYSCRAAISMVTENIKY